MFYVANKTCLDYRETRTYAVPILVEGQGTMPGVQVQSYDGALAKPRGELHLVPFVLEVTFKQIRNLIFLFFLLSW